MKARLDNIEAQGKVCTGSKLVHCASHYDSWPDQEL
jgi:hypothetical protein